MTDDLGNAWFSEIPPSRQGKNRREPKPDSERVVSYTEKDQDRWRTEALWGKQEETPRPRKGAKTRG